MKGGFGAMFVATENRAAPATLERPGARHRREFFDAFKP